MVYFLLPVYNEEANILPLLAEIRRFMQGKPYTIVAVNDGSLDTSLELLTRVSGRDLLIETYPLNMNVGAVFSTGLDCILRESGSNDDIAVIMEADQTSSIETIPALLRQIEQSGRDIVIASRYQKGGGYKNFPFTRSIFSFSANKIMRFFFPIAGVRDYTIFFRAYRVGILRKAAAYFGKFGLIQSKGFVANAELLVKLSLLTKRISEEPFIYNYAKKKGQSKISVVRTINEYFVLVMYLKRIFKKNRRLQSLQQAEKVLV